MNWLIIHFSTPCPGGSFLGFPTWYKYLNGVTTTDAGTGLTTCTPQIQSINNVWLILAAVIEILLRVAALAAVAFVVVGGVRYLTSQGEPDRTKQALGTIVSAAVGLVIALTAAVIVSFIAGQFKT